MSEWQAKSLKDVVELRRGFDLPHRERRAGPYPVLSSGTTEGWHDEAQVKGPGFVIGRATNLGRPTWSEMDFWPLNTTLYAHDFKGNDPRYLFHLFEILDLSGYNSGSVQPMLNRNYIARLTVQVAPLGEQRAIAEALGALDDKIVANKRMNSTIADLATSLLASRVPEVELGEIVLHHKESTNPAALEDEKVAHFALPAFDSGQIPEIVAPTEIKSSKYLVTRPSVLVSKLNPRFPRVWDVLQVPDEPALASTEFLVLESKFTSPSVLWAILSQPSFSVSLGAQVAGTSGSHQRVRPTHVLATKVVDPRMLEQRLQDQITNLGHRIALSRRESASLASLRDALLPQLMSGKLRVKDAEKTVEEVM